MRPARTLVGALLGLVLLGALLALGQVDRGALCEGDASCQWAYDMPATVALSHIGD